MEELCEEIFSEMKEIGVDLGDPKGDKSAKYIIDTKTLEVKEVDLIIHTIIAECCDWLAMNAELSHDEIEGCRNLMLTVKYEQLKAQKGNKKEIDYEEELKKCKANPLYFFDKYVKVKLKEQKTAWTLSEEMLEALYRVIPEEVKEKSEDEILLDKLYQGLKYGKVVSEKVKGGNRV